MNAITPHPSAPRCRVALIDDHASITDLLASVLQTHGDGRFEVVGAAHTGPDGLELCRRTQPDVTVLDMVLPGLSGVDLLRELFRILPGTRVLVFTGGANPNLLADALRLGAQGLVGKSAGSHLLLEALQAVAGGGRYLDPALLPQVGHGPEPPLSARERQVLLHVAEGGSNKEIASSLGISVKTVENHRTSLMEKLDLHDAVSLARYAIRTGLVPPP